MTTEDYLTQLETDRQNLIDNLGTKGITGLSGDETFTDLVPEVLNISSESGETLIHPVTISFMNSTDTEIDLSALRTDKVTSMTQMFYNCYNLKSLDFKNFDTSKVTDFSYFFSNSSNIQEINNFDKIDVSNATNISRFFYYTHKIPAKTLKVIENWDVSKVSACSNLFGDMGGELSSEILDLSNWRLQNVNTMFGSSGLYYIFSHVDLTGLVNSSITDLSYMFQNCYHLDIYTIKDWDTTNVTSMASMFKTTSNISDGDVLDLSCFETPKLTNTSNMFYGRKTLSTIDIRNMTFSNVTVFYGMFGTGNYYKIKDDCLIIVKDDTEKAWITSNFTNLTNVKTVAELEAS